MPTPPPDHTEIIARALITRGDTVLICEAVPGGYGYLPGGHVEPGEPAADAAARELMEEAAVTINVSDLLLTAEARFVATNRKGRQKAHHEITLVFAAALDPATEVTSREEGIRFRWVPIAELPHRDIRPAGIRDWAHQHLTSAAQPPPSAWLSEFEKSDPKT